jgi:hypothetical protein
MMTDAYLDKYKRYYTSKEPFVILSMRLINQISLYSLNQTNPQVTKEAVEVIQAITTAVTGEDVLRHVIEKKDINPELEHFLISLITNAYT